jgi:hypothetical protein
VARVHRDELDDAGHHGQRPRDQHQLGLRPDVATYASDVADRVKWRLGADLVGIWLFGSIALGDYDPSSSDIDIQAVARGVLPREQRLALAEALSHRALPCPARGLEFVLYAEDQLDPPRFQLNLNTGGGIEEHVALDADEDPRFWFVIDLAIGRAHGVPLAGPAPADVLPDVLRPDALAALADALSWFDNNEGHSAQTVLSACRAWAYAAEDAWLSKTAAATWARERSDDAALIDRALELRSGALEPDAVERLVARVAGELARARASYA